MSELVRAELTKVRQYQVRSRSSLGREEENAIYLGDVLLCGQLLVTAADLPWRRRKLVGRQLRKLFGANTVELCEVNGQDAANENESMAMTLQRHILGVANPEHGLPLPDRGQFDSALRPLPESRELRSLARSLNRLAKSW
jgi:hypothetical protein